MSERDSDLDPGLEAAFGEGDSVLSRLEQTSGIVPRILLHDPADDSGPVVKPGGNGGDEGKPPRQLGPYQVVGEIARGGVGIVMKGRDVDLGRDVALKLLRPGLDDDPALVQRFVEEAQVEGQLQHPGIVPVYGIGLEREGRPYFAMKLVKGETLSALLGKRQSQDENRRRHLGVFEQIAHTVAYAHARHVIHRDLKPANVLVGAFGEVQVVDWGFAKVLPRGGVADERRAARPEPETTIVRTVRTGSEGSESQIGSVMGTPAYMPPEQALGDVAHMDARSDAFSLGAILAEILTGKPPYVKEDGDVFRQAAGSKLDPCLSRLDGSDAHGTLVAIAKRCLAPEPADRYRDAGEVAEAVGSHLADEEERAREAQVAAAEARVKAEEERKKKKITLALAASVLLLVLLGGGGAWWLEGQRQTRVRDAVARVRSAMARAERLAGEAALAPVGERGPHEAAVVEARRAREMAGEDEVDEKTRRDVEALVASVEAQQAGAQAAARRRVRDLAMVKRLHALRMGRGDHSEAAVTDAAYAKTFAERGIEIETLTLGVAAERIRSSSIAGELCRALDNWALVRWGLSTADPGARRRLLEIAKRADTDPWRARLRTAAVERDATALRALADEVDPRTAAPSVTSLLGAALVRAGEADRAIRLARDALQTRPDDFWMNYQLALWLEGRDWNESARYYTAALSLRAGSYGVLHRLGLVLESQGQLSEAIAVWRDGLRHNPDEIHLHNHIAGALRKIGGLPAARADAEARTLAEPDDFASWFELAQLRAAGGDHEGAVTALRKAEALRPADSLVRGAVAWVLLAARRWPEALDAADRFLELEPYSAIGHQLKGRAIGAEGTGSPAAAEASYRKALELAPGEGTFYQSLGTCLMAQGKQDEAIEVYRSGLSRQWRHPGWLWSSIALIEMRRGRYDEARQACRKAIELEPWEAGHRVYYGVLLCDHLRRYDEAAERFREALRIDPENRNAWNNLGLALSNHGDLESAIEAYLGGWKRRSLRHGDLTRLITLLRGAGRLEEKLRVLDDALERTPDDPYRLYQAGYARLALNQTRGANLLRRCSLYPSEGEAAERWAAELAALTALAPRLEAIRRGEVELSDDEKLLAAHLLVYGARHRRAAEFFLEVARRDEDFVERPDPGGIDRAIYNALCAAALAGCGQGLDAGSLDDAERRRWRRQALAWSRENLAWWKAMLEAGDRTPEKVAEAGDYWRHDMDLCGVRTPLGLAALPEDERAAWKAFWEDLDALTERAETKR